MQILCGTVERAVYWKGLQCMILTLGKGVGNKLNVYLNPSIKPELMKLEGKEILLVEGDFLAEDASIFPPYLIVEWDENGLKEYQLHFG